MYSHLAWGRDILVCQKIKLCRSLVIGQKQEQVLDKAATDSFVPTLAEMPTGRLRYLELSQGERFDRCNETRGRLATFTH